MFVAVLTERVGHRHFVGIVALRPVLECLAILANTETILPSRVMASAVVTFLFLAIAARLVRLHAVQTRIYAFETIHDGIEFCLRVLPRLIGNGLLIFSHADKLLF